MEGAPGSRGRRKERRRDDTQFKSQRSSQGEIDTEVENEQTKTPKESEAREREKRETGKVRGSQREEAEKWTGWHGHAFCGQREPRGVAQEWGEPWGGGSGAGRGPGRRGCGEGKGVLLTLSSSSGRSPPSLMPRFMATKRSRPGLSRTLGL